MKQEVRQEIRDNEKILNSACINLLNAWVAGNKRDENKWDHYAAMIEARISYLQTIDNKGA